jgi:predicted transcriptional regulator
MKKIIVVIFVFLKCIQGIHSQDIDVSWGPLLKENKGGTIVAIVGHDQNGYYAVRNYVVASALITYADKLYLERYTNNHEMEYSHEIKLKDEELGKLKYEGIFYVGGKLIMFTSHYDKKGDRNIAYAEHLSESGEPEGDRVEVDRLFSDKVANKGSFQFIVAEDHSKILVIHQEMYKKDSREKFFYKMFDQNLKVLWEKKMELPFKDKYSSVGGYKIDAGGKVYAQCGVTNEKKEKGKANYTYYIIEYDPTADKMEKYHVNLAGKYISEITYADDPKHNNIVCAGFYSNKSGAGMAGVFYLRINKESKEITEKGIKDFGKEFLAQFIGEKKASKGKEAYSFDMRHFILREDGGAILVAEQYYVQEVCRSSGGTGLTVQRCDLHYYYKDIICASINPDASIAWVTRVPKFQHSVNDGGFYSSYLISMKGNQIFFLFNDNPKNMKLLATANAKKGKGVPVKMMTNPKKSVALLYTVDMATGEIDSKPLFNAKSDKATILRPKLYRQINDKDIVIYGERGKNYKFGTMSLN